MRRLTRRRFLGLFAAVVPLALLPGGTDMATPATLPNTPSAVSGNTLPDMFGTGFSHSEGINEIAGDVLNAWEKIGIGTTTPDAIHKTPKATAAGETAWGYYGIVKLGEAVGTGASGTIEVTSIPATFRSLYIELDGGRSDTASTVATVQMTFESSPTSGAYNHQRHFGGATTSSADENIGSSTFINAGTVPAASSTASLGSSIGIRIPGYASTSAFKTAIIDAASPTNLSSGGVFRFSITGVWEGSSAIDRVKLTLSAGNWTTVSRMTVWGLPPA